MDMYVNGDECDVVVSLNLHMNDPWSIATMVGPLIDRVLTGLKKETDSLSPFVPVCVTY